MLFAFFVVFFLFFVSFLFSRLLIEHKSWLGYGPPDSPSVHFFLAVVVALLGGAAAGAVAAAAHCSIMVQRISQKIRCAF